MWDLVLSLLFTFVGLILSPIDISLQDDFAMLMKKDFQIEYCV